MRGEGAGLRGVRAEDEVPVGIQRGDEVWGGDTWSSGGGCQREICDLLTMRCHQASGGEGLPRERMQSEKGHGQCPEGLRHLRGTWQVGGKLPMERDPTER